jgi:RND family efflux transporter MFP subunit
MQSRPGLIAQQEIDDAHSRDLVAEAQVSAAQSNLAAAEEAVGMNRADQAKTKTLIAYTRVAAPFSGVVTKRYADTGAMIQAGTASQTQARPLVRLAQSSMLRLILPVPESMVPSIHLGQSVDVTVPSLGRTFPGRVARFAHEVDRSTRTMQTEVDVPNPNYVLIPGMYAEVSLALERRDHVLSIPLGAIDPGEEVSKVFVVTPAGTVEIRDVALGIETADRAEIRSGVKQGEFVITGKRAGLKPGQHVTPKLTVSAKSA